MFEMAHFTGGASGEWNCWALGCLMVLALSAQSMEIKEGRKRERKEGKKGAFSIHTISGCWSKLGTHVGSLDLFLGEACFKQHAGGYSSTRRRRGEKT